MRNVWAFGILVCAGIFLWCVAHSQAGLQAPAGERADFEGKILAVFLRTAPANSLVLEKASVRRLADQPFLVGKYLDDPVVNGPRGRTTWLALIDVVKIVEFDNVDQLKEATRNSER